MQVKRSEELFAKLDCSPSGALLDEANANDILLLLLHIFVVVCSSTINLLPWIEIGRKKRDVPLKTWL